MGVEVSYRDSSSPSAPASAIGSPSASPTPSSPTLKPVPLSALPLLDVDSALEIPKDVADGFLILLSGGRKSAKLLKEQSYKQSQKQYSNGNYHPPNNLPQSPSPLRSHKSTSNSTSTSHSHTMDPSSLNFAFAALTDGNVIEATFGVQSHGGLKRSKNTSVIAYNAARKAKGSLLSASLEEADAIQQQQDFLRSPNKKNSRRSYQSSSSASLGSMNTSTNTNSNTNTNTSPLGNIKQLAVETYISCFEIIIRYHLELESIGYIMYCIKHQKIMDNASNALKKRFKPLNDVVRAYID